MLVTGVAGVAGYNAFHYLRRRYGESVIGVRPVNNWPLRGPGIFGCDLEDHRKLRQLLDRFGIRTVLHAGGSCALKACERDPAMAYRVNVTGTESLLDALVGRATHLTFLSIDLVFSGKGEGGYPEEARPDPVTIYGKTMVLAEQRVLRRRPSSALLRISLPMGVSFNGHAGAIDWIQSRFSKGRPATLYFDEIRTPTYVDCLNEVLEAAMVDRLAGLFHAGGPRRLSLFQIAQIVNRVGGYDPHLLQGCWRHEAGPMPPRAGNVTLDSSRLADWLGRDPFCDWPRIPEHRPDSPDWHYQRDRFRGSAEQIRQWLYQRNSPPGTGGGEKFVSSNRFR